MDICPIQHAKAYPFDIPQGSYVLDAQGWRPLSNAPELRARHAVIASGSNASPDRLQAKYADHPNLLDAGIPVMRAQLHDFDSVYSAHIASYGAIPATLAYAPGSEADVFVTWLTDAQLARMHQTEAVGVNYDFVKLSGIRLLCDNGAGMTTAHAYISKRGCLNKDGSPVPLAALNTAGRQWRAMTQSEALDFARSQTAPNEEPDTFIRQHIDTASVRTERTEKLTQTALPFGWSAVTVMNP